MPIMNIGPVPQSHDGFYATNNPYQVNGPKGFTEFKLMDENDEDLYARLDFPGVTKESVRILVEPMKKAVFVFGDAPKEFSQDFSHRKYGAATGLICDCCEISNIRCYVGDGVVRLVLSKKKINRHLPSSCSFGGATMPNVPFLANIIHGYNPEVGGHPLAHLRGHRPEGRLGTNPLDPAFTGPVALPHPSVLEGSTSAYESKHLPNGGLFLRIDMPGVPYDRFTVTVGSDGGITVSGEAPPALHDSDGREYIGKVAVVPLDYNNSRIKVIAKHGVIRLIIPPF
ncbi:HSP20-like chaperone [Hirschfeldia incana]|nr:HSP20-like chaperone [Hirschfeldia incana]